MADKIIVAMSGGVDSSAAAALLKDQGHELIGATLKLYDNEDAGISKGHTCCSLDDIEDARRVCNQLGFPHFVFNFKDGFRTYVMDHFARSYMEGLTPNPCIECNRHIKFDHLLLRARQLDYGYVATGHYARRRYDNTSGRYLLLTAPDESKDQTYMLFCLSQEHLAHTLFPVGELTKEEVRRVAQEHNLLNARKHDSQDICFVPDGDYTAFIKRYTGCDFPEGAFVDETGRELGRHKGIIRYTIGQRRGLGLALPAPLYVCGKDMEGNRVILGPNESLFSKSLDGRDLNLIPCRSLSAPIRVKAKVRYRQKAQWCTVEQTGPDTVHVEFDEPQRAITPGQAVVFYDGDVVVGGATICK